MTTTQQVDGAHMTSHMAYMLSKGRRNTGPIYRKKGGNPRDYGSDGGYSSDGQQKGDSS